MDILLAIGIIISLTSVFGLILGYAAIRFRVKSDPIIDKIEALLPQTQCGQCNYPGCRPYALAIAQEEADINQCPPGGDVTITALADLLGKDKKTLNPSNGEEKEASIALVIEAECIGCTLCIQACPVDAILGSAKMMHTVIADECTGCELCISPCPEDCIIMLPLLDTINTWKWPRPDETQATHYINSKKIAQNK